jgi:hypothetical protein
VPVIDLPDDELAALTKALRRLIKSDKYPHAPRLDPLRAALARLDAEAKGGQNTQLISYPKAPPPAKADKRARR